MRTEITEADMIRQMTEEEARSVGLDNALASVGRAIGVSRWTVWSSFYGRRKGYGVELSRKIRRAYLAHCRRQLAKAEASLRLAEEKCGADGFADFRAEISDLASRLQEAERRAQSS